MRLEDLDELLVFGMRQIHFSVCFRFECHKEAVREAVVEPFRAIVRSELERSDLWNGNLESAKCIYYFLNVSFVARFFELEHDNVSKHFGRFLLGNAEWNSE